MELPGGMDIHPVFHKSLIEKAPANAKPGLVLVHEETQEPLYDVERILDHATLPCLGKRYLVKWLGYEDSENTWEPTNNLPPAMVKEYHRRR